MDNQNCLNGNLGKLESTLHNLTGLKESVESLHTQVGWNADYIKDPRDKLEQAGHDLQTAETKIETLENRLATVEDEIQQLKFDSRIPPHPAIRSQTLASPRPRLTSRTPQ